MFMSVTQKLFEKNLKEAEIFSLPDRYSKKKKEPIDLLIS